MATLADNALTTLADVKESLGITSSDHTKDNLIIRKINSVSNLIENYCDRTFKLTQYSEDYDGSNTDELVLNQRPILVDASHTFSLQRRDTSLNEGDFDTVDTDLYFTDINSGVVELNFNAIGRWNRYRFSYWAGYVTTPNDLAEAANMLVCYFVNNPAGLNVGLIVKKEGQRELRYNPNNTGNTFQTIIQQLGIDDTLNSYSNIPLASDR